MTVEGKSASLGILFFLPSSLSPFKMNFKVLFTVESSLHALASCLKSASPIISASIQKTPVDKIEPSLKTNMGTSFRRFYAVVFILSLSFLVEESMEQLGVLMDKDLHCFPEQCRSPRS